MILSFEGRGSFFERLRNRIGTIHRVYVDALFRCRGKLFAGVLYALPFAIAVARARAGDAADPERLTRRTTACAVVLGSPQLPVLAELSAGL